MYCIMVDRLRIRFAKKNAFLGSVASKQQWTRIACYETLVTNNGCRTFDGKFVISVVHDNVAVPLQNSGQSEGCVLVAGPNYNTRRHIFYTEYNVTFSIGPRILLDPTSPYCRGSKTIKRIKDDHTRRETSTKH